MFFCSNSIEAFRSNFPIRSRVSISFCQWEVEKAGEGMSYSVSGGATSQGRAKSQGEQQATGGSCKLW